MSGTNQKYLFGIAVGSSSVTTDSGIEASVAQAMHQDAAREEYVSAQPVVLTAEA